MDEIHFEWKQEYSVDVVLLDEQHQKLFRIIDDLYQSLMSGGEKDIILKIFDGLNDYASVHFSTEEKYFAEFDFEGAPEHINQHEKFKADILKMEEQAKKGKLESFELFYYLENWWINHIIDSDKKYSKFFNKHGLK